MLGIGGEGVALAPCPASGFTGCDCAGGALESLGRVAGTRLDDLQTGQGTRCPRYLPGTSNCFPHPEQRIFIFMEVFGARVTQIVQLELRPDPKSASRVGGRIPFSETHFHRLSRVFGIGLKFANPSAWRKLGFVLAFLVATSLPQFR